MKTFDAVGENSLGFPRYATVVYCDGCKREIGDEESYHHITFSDVFIGVRHICNDCHNQMRDTLTGPR